MTVGAQDNQVGFRIGFRQSSLRKRNYVVNLNKTLASLSIGCLEVEPASHAIKTMESDGIIPEPWVAFAPDGNIDFLPTFCPHFNRTGLGE